MESKQAEAAFRDFLTNIQAGKQEGFLYETAGKRVYSFESWLREKQQPPGWCHHIKTTNYIKRMGRDMLFASSGMMLKATFYFTLATVFLYIILGTFLMMFDVSLWNATAFLCFLLAPVLGMGIFWLRAFTRSHKKPKAGNPASAKMVTIYIKIFDNDSFDFLPKGKLFKG